MKKISIKKYLFRISYTRIVAAGYFLLLLTGTLLLMLPFSAKDGVWTPFADALTTATSASCVTGLVVYDTFTHWSVFGQLVILLLIQTGGLGYMTIITLFSVLIGRKIGIRERTLLKESTNSLQIGGLVALVKKILAGTLMFEGIGALLLAFRFMKVFDIGQAFYYGVFHSVSAFCNAGFDLMGAIEPYSSLTHFNSDPVVLIVIMILIFTGGIGFVVWDDFCKNKFRFRKYKLHSKIAIVTSLSLIFAGALVLFVFEYNNTLRGMNLADKILNSLFSSVTTRTAGFNSIDTAAFSPGSDLLNIIYMLIGGSPGSTAGGMKTTTFAVIMLASWSCARNSTHVNIFSRCIEPETVRKALTVFIIYLSMTIGATFVICVTNQDITLSNVLFEAASAIGTVGLSCGVTTQVDITGQMALTLLMYCGRVGSMSFAMIFTQMKTPSHIKMPGEKIIIGYVEL